MWGHRGWTHHARRYFPPSGDIEVASVQGWIRHARRYFPPCGDIEVASVQGWIRHARRYFPRCLGRENVSCDVDEVLWPDPGRRRDEAQLSTGDSPPTNSWTAPPGPHTHNCVLYCILKNILLVYICLWFCCMLLYTTVMFGLINIFCFYIALVFTVYLLPLSADYFHCRTLY